MADEIPRSNAHAVLQQLREFEAMMRQMRLELSTSNRAVADLSDRVMILERAASEQRIKEMGTGFEKLADVSFNDASVALAEHTAKHVKPAAEIVKSEADQLTDIMIASQAGDTLNKVDNALFTRLSDMLSNEDDPLL